MKSYEFNLTRAGYILSGCMKDQKEFTAEYSDWKELYDTAIATRQNIRDKIKNSEHVLLMGAGQSLWRTPLDILLDKKIFKVGVNWTHRFPLITPSLIITSHTYPAQAVRSASNSIIVAHGSYSKIPPLINSSFTYGWADPEFVLKTNPTTEQIRRIIEKQSLDPPDAVFPRIYAYKNICMISISLLLSMGAKSIILSGFDPVKPDYYFSGISSIARDLIDDVIVTDNLLNDWDGRHERLQMGKYGIDMDSLGKTVRCIRHLYYSGLGNTASRHYVEGFEKSLKTWCAASSLCGISLYRADDSDFLKTADLPLFRYR